MVSVLPRTAGFSLFFLLASVGLTVGGVGSPVAVVHLAFAVAVVPLIFAAISHFVPVLTRTGDPVSWIIHLPLLAQLAGLLAVGAMQGWLPRHMLALLATVDLVLAAILLGWTVSRARRCLGAPHPGWRWYAAALGCLIVALLLVPVLIFFPETYRILRLIHLHLNMLGLVGLAALGTLPVLLPTVLNQADPEAAAWLRRRFWPAVLGVFAIALGAATDWPLAAPGAAILFVVAFGLLSQWIRRYRLTALLGDGIAASLVAALSGFLMMLAVGVAHSAGLSLAQSAIGAWAVIFLLPLVSGALSLLLPVWCWPGPVGPARLRMRAALGASGAWRSGAFLLAGLLLLAGFPAAAAAFLLGGLALFVGGLIQAVRGGRSTR